MVYCVCAGRATDWLSAAGQCIAGNDCYSTPPLYEAGKWHANQLGNSPRGRCGRCEFGGRGIHERTLGSHNFRINWRLCSSSAVSNEQLSPSISAICASGNRELSWISDVLLIILHSDSIPFARKLAYEAFWDRNRD